MTKFINISTKNHITGLLARADVTVNGERPWDIQVKNNSFFSRIVAQGSLALGESYMDGWWECECLDQLFFKILRARLDRSVEVNPPEIFHKLKERIMNRQNTRRAREVGEKHYDIGNDLFELMLDKRMIYSCGYWEKAANLNEAQRAKLDMICRKLGLARGMRLLDIGCGWGGLARYAARHYGTRVVGLTISKEQARMAEKRCAGLPVQIRLQDYREPLNETFDAVVSVGMFEHVGAKNYPEFMEITRRHLKSEGVFLLHTIGSNNSSGGHDPWIDKYIFPNGMLPSIKQIVSAAEKHFILEDWHNIGAHYDTTLVAWHENFKNNWDQLKARYGERFFRMWSYYLLCLAGCFRARHLQVWQAVFSPNGRLGGYASNRCSNCPAK